eukprot:1395837-Rhodomonas_salina.1
MGVQARAVLHRELDEARALLPDYYPTPPTRICYAIIRCVSAILSAYASLDATRIPVSEMLHHYAYLLCYTPTLIWYATSYAWHRSTEVGYGASSCYTTLRTWKAMVLLSPILLPAPYTIPPILLPAPYAFSSSGIPGLREGEVQEKEEEGGEERGG